MKAFERELQVALDAAQQAAAVIMQIYQQESDLEIESKSDFSPITVADRKADEIIRGVLGKAFPDYGMLSEELEDEPSRLQKPFVWIVDPLDGTKDFIARTDEFSVNIALAYQHEIVLGVIAIPAKDEIYYAVKKQGSYYLKNQQVTKIEVSPKRDQLIVLRSNFHRKKVEDDFLKQHQEILGQQLACGSAYKACLIACGKAHYSIKLGSGTKEWDIAASDILIQEAGGFFADSYGRKIEYNRRDTTNHHGYVIINHYNPRLLAQPR